MSQELMNSTDSVNYYSAIMDQQPYAKQTNCSDGDYKVRKWPDYWLRLHAFGQQNIVPDYELPSGSCGHKNDRESNDSHTVGKN